MRSRSEPKPAISSPPLISGESVAIGGENVLLLSGLDITKRKQIEARLTESEERFRTMANGLPLLIWVHDAQGGQQFVNQTFYEYFDVTPSEIDQDKWQSFVDPESGGDYLKEFFACIRDQRPFHGEALVKRGDGQWRWLESWGKPRFSASGDFLGLVGTSADITDRKQLEETLKAAKEEAEKANQAKSDFLANIEPRGSHTHERQSWA